MVTFSQQADVEAQPPSYSLIQPASIIRGWLPGNYSTVPAFNGKGHDLKTAIPSMLDA